MPKSSSTMAPNYATSKQLEELESKITSKLTREIATLQADLKACKQEIAAVKQENQALKEENQALRRDTEANKEALTQAEVKADDLENRQRRSNLVFHGVEGDELRETWEDVEKKLQEYIRTDLRITDRIEIERAHRSGIIRADNKPRPVVALFSSWKQKELVKKKSKELKNHNTYVTEDYSWRIRQIRKKLMQYAENNKTRDSRFHLRFDKLIMDSVAYGYDELADEVIECRRFSRRDQEERESANRRNRARNTPRREQCQQDNQQADNNRIRLISWNVHGLRDKLSDSDFINFVKDSDIFILLETWMPKVGELYTLFKE